METIDFSTMEILLAEQNEILADILDMLAETNMLIGSLYSNSLFLIGVLGALLVLFLLYRFLRLFF